VLAAGVRFGEEMVLAPQGHGAEGAFGGIVIDFEAASRYSA
jgi:hypothetical protein